MPKVSSRQGGIPLCTAGILHYQDEIFPGNRFSPPKRNKKVVLLYFYDAYDVNL